METTTTTHPHGYTYGTAEVARSPLSADAFDRLLATVLFTDADRQALRKAGDVLEGQIEDVLDLWYGFVGAHPHLVRYFEDAEGRPIPAYLERVRARFGQWIRDTCRADYDRAWLDYQQEIALRHAVKKNTTDGVAAATALIPLRYMVAFIYPITATMRGFLAKSGAAEAEVEAMHQAWFKAVVLQVTLWSEPYARQGMF